MTEVWFRNPISYMKECAEMLVPNHVWDRGFAIKKRCDPQRYLEANYPKALEYRILLIGEQGAAELRAGHDLMTNPYAVYPVWRYGTLLRDLRELLENPVGQDVRACTDPNTPIDERPILGQEHRVVITDLPDSRSMLSRGFFYELSDIQAEFPEAIIHLHGTYSFRLAFGMGYGSADMDPREHAAVGRISYANGRVTEWERWEEFRQWVHVVGFSARDLGVPRNRCMFNIASSLWAGKYWDATEKFAAMAGNPEEIQRAADAAMSGSTSPVTFTKSHLTTQNHTKMKSTDMITCDTCSFTNTCKYFRDGAVCTVPGTESSRLAASFSTKDAGRIIEGALTALRMQADRAERAVEDEKWSGEQNKETTTLLHTVFHDAMQAAKIIDPSLAPAKTKVGVFINQQPAAPMNVLVAEAMQALEKQGYRREDISDEMITAYMINKERQQQAIEVTTS